MSEKQAVINMHQVEKKYPKATSPAVQDINLEILSGEKIGLIGANGSGKTTLLRLLMNFVLPDKGSIQIMGSSDLEKTRRFIGFVSEHQKGMENFTPRELMRISAKMHGLSNKTAEDRIQHLLKFSRLTEVADRLLSSFSKGMAQRVQICISQIHQPSILLMDEPMSGLDPGGQKDVRELLKHLKKSTMLYASHHLEEIETFCSAVIIIHQGKIIRRLNLQEIQQQICTLDLVGRTDSILSKFIKLTPEILSKEKDQSRIRFTADSASIQELMTALKHQNIDVKKIPLSKYFGRSISSLHPIRLIIVLLYFLFPYL